VLFVPKGFLDFDSGNIWYVYKNKVWVFCAPFFESDCGDIYKPGFVKILDIQTRAKGDAIVY
jgi:hypothetical protein